MQSKQLKLQVMESGYKIEADLSNASLLLHSCSRPEAYNVIKKETLVQAFPCEFCEILKKHLFYRTTPDDCSCYFFLVILSHCFCCKVRKRQL